MESIEVFGCPKEFILKQRNDWVPVGEICRKSGISQATHFNWKKKYTGLLPSRRTPLLRYYMQADDDLEHIRERRRPDNPLAFAL